MVSDFLFGHELKRPSLQMYDMVCQFLSIALA